MNSEEKLNKRAIIKINKS